jgi:hypothetical protein
MDVDQIRRLEPKLAKFLDLFHDCFDRKDNSAHLGVYVRGQIRVARAVREPATQLGRVNASCGWLADGSRKAEIPAPRPEDDDGPCPTGYGS